MSVLFVAVPIALLLASSAVAAFLWAARGGQLDDLDTPPLRMLAEDERSGKITGAGEMVRPHGSDPSTAEGSGSKAR